MVQDTVIKTLKQFEQALEAANIQVEQLILFGSHATSTAREDSDIDLLLSLQALPTRVIGNELIF